MTKQQKIRAYRLDAKKLNREKHFEIGMKYFGDKVSDMFYTDTYYLMKPEDGINLSKTILLSCAELVRLDFNID